MKRYLSIVITLLACLMLGVCGCGKTKEQVTISIWTSSENKDVIQKAADEFIKLHNDEADITINIQGEKNISGMKKLVMSDIDAAADIFIFVDDQFNDLKNNDALLPISLNQDKIIEDCGGRESLIVRTVMEDDTIYAYPATNSNGYFMYYNADYFDEKSVENLDDMLAIAAKNDKYVAMDWSSGWYLYSFFGGAGKQIYLSEDGLHNVCDFNSTSGKYTGVDVVNSMLSIANHKGFKNVISDNLMDLVKSGEVIAAVSGTWNATEFANVWGDSAMADKLPKFTINGDKVQMKSFAGFKYYGVNSHTKNPQWSMMLCEWITNYDNQLAMYDAVGECPANIYAAESENVLASKSITALRRQNEYAVTQSIGDNYWNPMAIFGAHIASGNKDEADLQELLDSTVEEIIK